MTCRRPSNDKNVAYSAPRHHTAKSRFPLKRVTFAEQPLNHQECVLRALKIANENASRLTNALTAKLLYKSGKYNDDSLIKMLNRTSSALEIAHNEYTRATNDCSDMIDIAEKNGMIKKSSSSQSVELASCA